MVQTATIVLRLLLLLHSSSLASFERELELEGSASPAPAAAAAARQVLGVLCEWVSCCVAVVARKRYWERARGVTQACELARSQCCT